MVFFKRRFKKKTHKTGIKKLVRKVNRIERRDKPEMKHVQGDISFTPPMSVEVYPSQSVRQILFVPQGTGGAQRLGNVIMASHLKMRFHLINFQNGVQTNAVAARVMIVLDKRSNKTDIGASAQNISELMYQSTVNLQYLDPANLLNYENKGRFKILYDKVIEVGRLPSGTTSSTDNQSYKRVSKVIKIKHKVVFDKNTTTSQVDDVIEGNLWLIYKPQQLENVGALVAAPQMHFFYDYYFTDV